MNTFRLVSLSLLLADLKGLEDECIHRRQQAALPSFDEVASPKYAEGNVAFRLRLDNAIEKALDVCTSLNLSNANTQITMIQSHHEGGNPTSRPDYATWAADLRNTITAIQGEVFQRLVVQIDARFTAFVDNPMLFGKAVRDAFPSAVSDIKEAGNCLAIGSATATVFHLMRVAEYGLRALAHDRRIKIPKNRPLELATWEDIIRQLEDVEKSIQTYPQTLAREAQFVFYHGAMMEFKRFKNKFRNRIMHTRDSYDPDEAMSAFNHVRQFMDILASRISERQRTPMIWKGKKWELSA